MQYTDAEAYGDDVVACIYPDATGSSSRSWCGGVEGTDSLTACATLAPTLDDYLRQEAPVCTTCVNEMARAMNLPPGMRIQWVEDYAGGTLADHLHEQADEA